jgi:hypothetical protein
MRKAESCSFGALAHKLRELRDPFKEALAQDQEAGLPRLRNGRQVSALPDSSVISNAFARSPGSLQCCRSTSPFAASTVVALSGHVSDDVRDLAIEVTRNRPHHVFHGAHSLLGRGLPSLGSRCEQR